MPLVATRFRTFPSLLLAALAALPLTLAAPSVSAADAPAKRTITHEDLWLMKRPGSTAVSPDGRWLVVSVADPSYDDAQKGSDLWIVATDGSVPPRRLTSGKAGEGDPVWSPDGTRLAFTAKREGDDVSQVYVLELAGGEAQRVTDWATGAKSPQFSPDGRSILFQSMTYPGAVSNEDNRKAAADRKARKYNVRTFDSYPIRHWDRWLDETRPTIVVQSLDGTSPPRDLLAGTQLRANRGYGGQLGNEGDSLDATWAPDGRSVVFSATTMRDEAARANVFNSLWQVSVDGGEPRRLTPDENDYGSPKFTPDGRVLLAKVQPKSEKWVYVASRLVRWSWPSLGERQLLTSKFEDAIGDYEVAPDSSRVYFTAERKGYVKVFELPLASDAAPRPLSDVDAGSHQNLSVGGSADKPVVATVWSSAARPHEAGRFDSATGQWVPLTSFNTAAAAAVDLPPVEEFWFTSKRGRKIHNFVVKPPGFDAGKKYPLFVVIHGGPHTMWQDQWVLRWNYHLLAAPGYVVLLTNYSGSTGFGEDFARAIQFDPLEGPGGEVNEAADEAIRRYGFIDASRQAAGGASYGGHLANWLAVSTDRYRALVSHAGLYDLKTQWTTSDTNFSRERNIGGPAWETSNELWRKQSPFYRSKKLKTPILVTCGERDYRVPCNNAIEFFMVLQRQEVPSRLVLFPDENHWILKGENSRHFYQEVRDWLAKYL
jgi:dipeptidyl aminopeptidase/acylaminoacyl peptidase